MPIYKDGKLVDRLPLYEVTNYIAETESMNEGVFKGDPPKEFISFAKDFAKKISKKEDFVMGVKNIDPIDYIESKSKWKYSFKVDDPKNHPVGSIAASSALAGLTLGVSTVVDVVVNDKNVEKATSHLTNILKTTGMKHYTNLRQMREYFYKVSSGKKYLFIAWPAVAMSAGMYSVYSIMLQCVKYNDFKGYVGLSESAVTCEIPGFDCAEKDEDGKLKLSSIFAGFEDEDMDKCHCKCAADMRKYQPYPGLKTAFSEHFDITDNYTRTTLLTMTEAQHNTALTALTSKLYDHIVNKTHEIDFNEIPKTKGDITKLSNYETLKDTLAIIKGIVTEYKQDTKPIDDISLAMANVQTRKDLFERGFRSNCEMPMLMYDNMVMAIVVGTGHMIAATIEFIKAPKDESFIIQLDKIAYNKSKDHLIYNSIAKFNHICENGDFDKAMNMIIDKKIRKFTGLTIAGGIVVGVIILANIIPLLRELVYLFYHTRVQMNDYFEMQADLLTMNAYNLQYNDVNTNADDKAEIIEKQNKIAEKFRKAANFVSIKDKKAEVEATKEIENSAKKYKLDDEANIVSVEPDTSTSSSALF